MAKFRLMEQAGLDGTVTVVHSFYGYTYLFRVKTDRSGLSERVHTRGERAEWFAPEAKRFAEMEARRCKMMK